MTKKLVAMALSSLGALSLAIPVEPGLAGGVIDYDSTWKLASNSGWTPANLTTDEAAVLKTLCRLAIGANGGTWQSERINSAISVLAFGADPPDNLYATVYKTCMMAGGMDMRRRSQ